MFLCVSQTVMKKLTDATNNTRTWKHKVAEHEGLLRLIQPGKHTARRQDFAQTLTSRLKFK